MAQEKTRKQGKENKKNSQDYPDETIAVSSSGKKEARVLESTGTYVKYNYIDTASGKQLSKYSILLKNEKGKLEHLFVVPAGSKELVVKHSTDEKTRSIYDPVKKKPVKF